MGYVTLKGDNFLLRDTPFVRHLRTRLNDPDLVTYFRRDTGQWVLAYWLDKNKGLVDELEDLGDRMQMATPYLVTELVACRRATNFDGIKSRIKNKARQDYNRWEAANDDMQKYRDWCKKRYGAAPMFC